MIFVKTKTKASIITFLVATCIVGGGGAYLYQEHNGDLWGIVSQQNESSGKQSNESLSSNDNGGSLSYFPQEDSGNGASFQEQKQMNEQMFQQQMQQEQERSQKDQERFLQQQDDIERQFRERMEQDRQAFERGMQSQQQAMPKQGGLPYVWGRLETPPNNSQESLEQMVPPVPPQSSTSL